MSSPQDKISPQHVAPHTEEVEADPQPLATVDKNGSNVKKKESGEGEEDYHSNIHSVRKFFQRNPPTPQGIFNLLVTIATIFLTFITKWQYDVQVLDQRAWIGIDRATVVDDLAAGKPMVVEAGIKNAGKTPAIHIFYYGQLSLWKSTVGYKGVPFNESSNYASCVGPKPKWEDVPSGGMIVPGADIRYVRVSKPIQKEYVELKRNYEAGAVIRQPALDVFSEIPVVPDAPPNSEGLQIDLYLVGCVNYFDIFRNAHRTTFCFQYGYDRALVSQFPKGAFVSCDKGNDAD